eukprot:scaffold2582_cov162-Ochromonas_danica.AAC.34
MTQRGNTVFFNREIAVILNKKPVLKEAANLRPNRNLFLFSSPANDFPSAMIPYENTPSSSNFQQGYLQYLQGDRCQKVFVTVQANAITLFSDDPAKTSSPLQPLAHFETSKIQLIESGDFQRPKSFGLSVPNLGLVEFACPTNSVRSAWVKSISEVARSNAIAAPDGRMLVSDLNASFRAPASWQTGRVQGTTSSYRPPPSLAHSTPIHEGQRGVPLPVSFMQTSSYVRPPTATFVTPQQPPPQIRKAVPTPSSGTAAIKASKEKPKELPKWNPGNYKSSRVFSTASKTPSQSRATSQRSSPQRARGVTNQAGNTAEYDGRGLRSASAPPVSLLPSQSMYPGPPAQYVTGYGNISSMPMQPSKVQYHGIATTQQAQVMPFHHLQQFHGVGVSHGQQAFLPPPTQRNSGRGVDHLTIGELREALQSIPSPLRSSIVKDMGRSSSRNHVARHRDEHYDLPEDENQQESQSAGYAPSKSEHGTYHARHHQRSTLFSREHNECLSDGQDSLCSGASENKSSSPFSPPHGGHRNDAFPPGGMREEEGEEDYYRPLIEKQHGSGSHAVADNLKRSQSTPPANRRNKETSREATLEWSKKQAQQKLRGNQASSVKARDKTALLSRAASVPLSSRLSLKAANGAVGVGSGPPAKRDVSRAKTPTISTSRQPQQTESFFDFLKKRDKPAAHNDKPEAEASGDHERTRRLEKDGSVLLHSQFVKSNEELLSAYRRGGETKEIETADPLALIKEKQEEVKPAKDVKSIYESLKAKTSVMRFNPSKATAPGLAAHAVPSLPPKVLTAQPSATRAAPTQEDGRHFTLNAAGDSMTDLAEWQRFTNWLESIGMSGYVENMREHGVSKLSIIELLTESDLQQIGVSQLDIPLILRKVHDMTRRIRSFSEQALSQEKSVVASGGGRISPNSPPRARLQLYQDTQSLIIAEEDVFNPKTIKRDLFRSFDNGEGDRFRAFWKTLNSKIVALADSPVRVVDGGGDQFRKKRLLQKKDILDFHLHLYFCIYPMKHGLSKGKALQAKEALRLYLDDILSRVEREEYDREEEVGEAEEDGSVLEKRSQLLEALSCLGIDRLTSSKEFATFAGLVFVPFPQLNPAYKGLFEEEWSQMLRERLESFVDCSLEKISVRAMDGHAPTEPSLPISPLSPFSPLHPSRLESEESGSHGNRHEEVDAAVPPTTPPASLPASPVGNSPAHIDEKEGLGMSPMAEEDPLIDYPSPSSSISQLTDDTALKMGGHHSSGGHDRKHSPRHHASEAPTGANPSSLTMSEAASRAALRLKAMQISSTSAAVATTSNNGSPVGGAAVGKPHRIGFVSSSSNRSALQQQVDNYNRRLRMNLLNKSPPAEQGSTGNNIAPPVEQGAVIPGNAEVSSGLTSKGRFNLGISAPSSLNADSTGVLNLADRVSRYKAILQSRQHLEESHLDVVPTSSDPPMLQSEHAEVETEKSGASEENAVLTATSAAIKISVIDNDELEKIQILEIDNNIKIESHANGVLGDERKSEVVKEKEIEIEGEEIIFHSVPSFRSASRNLLDSAACVEEGGVIGCIETEGVKSQEDPDKVVDQSDQPLEERDYHQESAGLPSGSVSVTGDILGESMLRPTQDGEKIEEVEEAEEVAGITPKQPLSKKQLKKLRQRQARKAATAGVPSD